MRFTGQNLRMVAQGLACALSEIDNQIATCPDPDDPEFADTIDELEAEQERFRTLLARVNRAITEEAKG